MGLNEIMHVKAFIPVCGIYLVLSKNYYLINYLKIINGCRVVYQVNVVIHITIPLLNLQGIVQNQIIKLTHNSVFSTQHHITFLKAKFQCRGPWSPCVC